MSANMPDEPFADRDAASPIETVILPRTRDLGDGFEVRRALPSMRRRMVGPFIFFDQMGPAVFRSGQGLDVRPHPHIGLATVTYLFDGEILHRDSLGTVQPIRPGAVNWMTAGRGIAHSERTPPSVRAKGGRLSGIQIWVALPKRQEQTDPAFAHTPADELPVVEDGGKRVRLIAGSLYGARSPVRTLSELFYADAVLEPGAARGACRSRGARNLRRGRLGRPRRRDLPGRPARDPPAPASGRDRGAWRCARAPAGRRDDGRSAAHLVEPGLQLARADRAGESGLGVGTLSQGSRRDGLHPSSGP